LIGQEPHSGRDLGGDIISNADGSERERERDFVSPITHLESICASLAVGRKDSTAELTHVTESWRHMPHI